MTQPVDPSIYGTDLRCREDADAADRTSTGIERLAEELFHSITTRRGAMLDAPDRGIDVQEMLLKPMTSAQLESRRNEILEELRNDDRILGPRTEVFLKATNRERTAWLLTIRIYPVDEGPFRFVVSVSAAAVLLVSVQAEGA